MLELLLKCLRGPAFVWYQSIQETLKNAYLIKYMEVLIVKFKKQPSSQSVKFISKAASQPPVEYYNCTVCSALFLSIARLLSHTQTATCNKASCKRCEKVFDSKNKLHEHLRNRDCQTPLQGKSIAPPKCSLSALASAETTTLSSPVATSPMTPLPTYRTVSPPPPTYETAPKTYLTVADLYMRYAPLKSAKSSWIRPVTRSRTVFPTMTVKDLYGKFHDKEREKSVTSTPKWTLKSLTNHSALSSQKSDSIVTDKSIAKTSFFNVQKPLSQRSNTPHRRHTKTTDHAPLIQIPTSHIRHYDRSPLDLAVAVKSPTCSNVWHTSEKTVQEGHRGP